jgi:putative iron-dependent peroxidase
LTTPQTGLLAEANSHALFLTLDLEPGGAALQRVRTLLSEVPSLTEQLAAEHPGARLCSVAALGPGIWGDLVAGAPPVQLAGFRPRTLSWRKAPATPTDLLLHIRSERRDLNFALARRILARAERSVHVREEVPAFRYLDSRDLTGFVDGSENPEDEERAEVALVGEEDPAHAGGSYVLVQRFEHDLERWETLDVAAQEAVIGRTKDTDQELDDAIKPETAHISRVVIEEQGEELEILRHSLPYGDSSRAGLVFIAYCRRREIFDRMLDRMFDSAQEGVHDHLMDYTRAQTGAFFFAPSLQVLQGSRQ